MRNTLNALQVFTRRSGIRLASVLGLAVFAAGCNDGHLIDAAGAGGGGGAAFVLFVIFFWGFIASLFYMDKIRRKKSNKDT